MSYVHEYKILTGGIDADQAKGALILVHGRGASATSILALAGELNVKDLALYAPQATRSSWYPYSFMENEADNQPALDSALEILDQLADQIIAGGIKRENLFFLGFSQGACLTLEYVTRNAYRYGGVVAFTGGLIGQSLDIGRYKGSFANTPVLVTTGDPDPHIPLSRIEESLTVLKSMGAAITSRIFKGRPHTIINEELELANQLIFNK